MEVQKIIRITILGKDVGKSTLLIKYSKCDESNINYKNFFESNINIEGQDYKLELQDTISEDDAQNILEMWLSCSDGLILMFAINDEDSFQVIKQRHKRIMEGLKGRICPMILVGNKKDLENQRQVKYDEAKSVANSWGIKYIEISVETNFNVNEVFEKLAQDIVKCKYPKPKKIAHHCSII